MNKKQRISEQRKRYREENREKIYLQKKAYRERYKEQIKLRKKLYYEANKAQILADQRDKRRSTDGFILTTYQDMRKRVQGKTNMSKYYLDLELLPKDVFVDWAKNDETFHQLFEDWVNSEYCRKLAPSIDRIDSSKGYTLDNMQWLTVSQNSSKRMLERGNPSKIISNNA